MADEVRYVTQFVVHQTLHGYSEGHRLLAGSVALAAPDARAMLVLSDVSGNAKLPPGGYLTGYPLAASGKYVLGRTWAAPEMQRPGCVWTHSLLIDFADLATLRSASPLSALFARPKPRAYGAFGKPVKIVGVGSPPAADINRQGPGMALLGALYGHPAEKVFGQYSGEEDERLVLDIWMQQWPRLRRSFRFCSFSAADRSTSADSFDLQLFEKGDPSHRTKIPDARGASEKSFPFELEPLLDDLLKPDRNGFRTFLHNVGGDISDGRSAMLPLNRLFMALGPGSVAKPDLGEAVSLLTAMGPTQARGARILVVEQALDNIETLDAEVFDFVMENLGGEATAIDDPLAERLGHSMWTRSPSMFMAALHGSGAPAHAASLAVRSINYEELIEGLKSIPEAAPEIALRRSDLLTNTEFWRVPSVNVGDVLGQKDVGPQDPTGIITALIDAERGDAAETIARRFDGIFLIRAVEASLPGTLLTPWLSALRRHVAAITGALGSGAIRRRDVLIALARTFGPDTIAEDHGADPWVTALNSSDTSTDDNGENYLAAFLLTRSLGRRSPTPARLMAISLDRAHTALGNDTMPRAGWQIIQERLPWVFPWQEWDRCGRVREAVVARFIDDDLPPGEFMPVTRDDSLRHALAKIAGRTSRGRRFLDRVSRS